MLEVNEDTVEFVLERRLLSLGLSPTKMLDLVEAIQEFMHSKLASGSATEETRNRLTDSPSDRVESILSNILLSLDSIIARAEDVVEDGKELTIIRVEFGGPSSRSPYEEVEK